MDLPVADFINILNLVARFNRSLDERDWSGFEAFFTEDAVMSFSGDSRFEGRSAIGDVVRQAEEGSYLLNFHMGGLFTTDDVSPDRVVIDLPVLGFGVLLPEKGDGIRFSGARSKWTLVRRGPSWVISESHHRTLFAAAVAKA